MRKQTEGVEEQPNVGAPSTKSSRFMSALDEALYSSDEESEEEEDRYNRNKKGSKPVSYTHLDVYKRQPQCYIQACVFYQTWLALFLPNLSSF